MDKYIDLRSDTVTKPCTAMRQLMASSEVGDDVYGEDPTVNRLEQIAAKIMGKEAALFVTSGTMGNQLAVLAHTNRGDEIILEKNAHIYAYEVGGIAMLAGVMPNTIIGHNGKIAPEQLIQAIRPENIHYPRPALLCLENSSNFGGGTVYTLEEINALIEIARKNGLMVHMDGARIFNAAAHLKIPVYKMVENVDSVMFCLSKGLGAPVGSMVVGTGEFINKARKYRKMLGGGLRQAGILAAAGIYALENLVERLNEDHENAGRLAVALNEIPGLSVELGTVQTNIVMVDIEDPQINALSIMDYLKASGVLVNNINDKRLRFVTHRDVSDEDINYTIELLKKKLAR